MSENNDGQSATAESSPLVSIALCTYNGARYLRQQLDSLLAQTYPHVEIVASDDGSTDDTVTILNSYAERSPVLRVYAHPTNVGLTRNFERALKDCRGLYIAPCDQDDVWEPEKIASLLAVVGGSSLAYCNSSFVDQDGNSMQTRMSDVVNMISTHDPLPFAFANCVSGHAMLFKREVLRYAFPIPEFFFYDWWLATVAAALNGIVYCDRSLVSYRQHSQNVTDTLGRRQESDPGQLRGHRIRFLRETQRRLESIADLPGDQQKFAAELLTLWRAREEQWVSLGLGRVMMRNRARFHAISRISERTVERQSKQFYWGLKAKRLSNPHGYTLPLVIPSA